MKSRTPLLKPILVSWIDHADLKAAEGAAGAGLDPLAQAAAFKEFARIVLLNDSPVGQTQRYRDSLLARTGTALALHPVTLSSPIDVGEIDQAARQVLNELAAGLPPGLALMFHLSPGTLTIMMAIWVLLAKTRFPAELIRSSETYGILAQSPFDIAAEFLPNLLQQADRRLGELSAGGLPMRAEFAAILHRSVVM